MKKVIFILLLFKLTDSSGQNGFSFLLKPSVSIQHYSISKYKNKDMKFYPNPNVVWGLSYTRKFKKIKHSMEVELLYFNNTTRLFYSINNNSYEKYELIEVKHNQIIMPINFQFNLNKSNISIGIVPTFKFGGYNYYSSYKVKNDNSYIYTSWRWQAGVQLKYAYRILENEKSMLFVEPYLLSYDLYPEKFGNKGNSNVGIGLKWFVK
jgi:hypothetical protein